MNISNIIKLVAALAWGGVAVSSATPASAIAVTNQSGAYASCSASYSTSSIGWKFCESEYTCYTQQIKFINTACNQGGCTGDTGTVWTDMIYPVGRKVTYGPTQCGLTENYNVYEIGSCAC
jgi:hypothetical protein